MVFLRNTLRQGAAVDQSSVLILSKHQPLTQRMILNPCHHLQVDKVIRDPALAQNLEQRLLGLLMSELRRTLALRQSQCPLIELSWLLRI